MSGIMTQNKILCQTWQLDHSSKLHLVKKLSTILKYSIARFVIDKFLWKMNHIIFFSTYVLQPTRLIVRSGLDVPTFATRLLHACHHARAPSGGRWNCGREMSGNFA